MKFVVNFVLFSTLSIVVMGQESNAGKFYKHLASLWNKNLRCNVSPRKKDSAGVVYLRVFGDDDFFKNDSSYYTPAAGSYLTLFYSCVLNKRHNGLDSIYVDFSNLNDTAKALYHWWMSFRELDTLQIGALEKANAFLFLCPGYFNHLIEDKHFVVIFKFDNLVSENAPKVVNYQSLFIMGLLKKYILDDIRKYKEFVFVYVDAKHHHLINSYYPRSKYFKQTFKNYPDGN
jgi:hypothetical protein